MAGSTYVFRQDIADEKQRQHDLAQGAPATLAPAPTSSPAQPLAPTPAQSDPFAAAAKQINAAPSGPKQKPFEAFSAALEAQNPFKQQVQQGVSQTLENPYAGADAAAKAARDRLARETNAAAEERRGQAVTAYGGYGTGQAARDINKFNDQRLLNQQDFELQVAANREAAGQSARQGAVSQGLGLLGQGTQEAQTLAGLADAAAGRASQERIAFANLSVQEKQLAQQAAQAKDEMSFKREALANGNDQAAIDRAWQAAQQAKHLASQEKISFAQLSFQEKQLAQDADQFKSKQDFEKYALQNGNDQAAIDRAWNASQNTEERLAREKIANAQIGSTERLQASAQTFQASEAAKQRTLESMLSNDRIQAQLVLANMDQAFQERMQKTGYLQTKDLQTMKQDFEKQLADMGIKADAAKQLSDQQFQSMMAKNEQVFNASQAELNRAWETGERVDAQDWQTSFKQLEFAQQDLMQQREAALAKGLQTQQIDAEIQKVGMQLASQELMSAAQLAQNDSQFQQEWMLKNQVTQEDLRQSQVKLEDYLKTSVLERVGLDLQNQQVKQVMQGDKLNAALQLANIGMTMGNGSAEAMAPFVAQMGAALEAAFKEQGIDVSQDARTKAFGPLAASSSGSIAAPDVSPKNPGSIDAVQTAKDYLNEIAGTLPSNTDITKVGSILDAYSSGKPGTSVPTGSSLPLGAYPGAKANFNLYVNNQAPTAPPAALAAKTQAGADFILLNQLIKTGLSVAQAYETASRAVGKQRMYNAINAVTGKNFDGTTL